MQRRLNRSLGAVTSPTTGQETSTSDSAAVLANAEILVDENQNAFDSLHSKVVAVVPLGLICYQQVFASGKTGRGGDCQGLAVGNPSHGQRYGVLVLLSHARPNTRLAVLSLAVVLLGVKANQGNRLR